MSSSQSDESRRSLVEEFLSHPSRFPGWSAATRRRLVEEGRLVHVARQTVLATAGEVPEACYMIMEGVAAATTPTPQGADFLPGFLYPGAFLGLAAMFTDQGLIQNWYAQSTLKALRIPRRTFVECCLADPKMALFVLDTLVGWGRAGAIRTAHLIHADARGRVVFALLSIFEQQPMTGDRHRGHLHLSQNDLCRMTGLTRQSISTHLRALRELGVLDPESTRIVVKSVDRLREMAVGLDAPATAATR